MPNETLTTLRPRNGFRFDINGLRAIAVLIVLFFHFGIAPFGGGFVGVDVFFVISGYLMTGIIVSGIRNGTFRIFDFYVRRIARLLPALLAVTAAAMVAGYFLLLPQNYERLASDSMASLLFAVNFSFARNTGYFAVPPDQQWLLHFWSLAVEFQFYLVFPIFVMLSEKFLSRRNALIGLVLVFTASLALSWVGARLSPTEAFFMLPGRIWEFLLGGVVVFSRAPPRSARYAVVVAGIVVIISSAITFDGGLDYPGLWASIPALGAALVIWANSDARFFQYRVIQSTGTISYSLYLWHWPIIAIGKYLGTNGGWLVTTFLFALSFPAAHLSFRYIEAPLRLAFRKGCSGRSVLVGAGATAALACCGLILFFQGLPGRIPETLQEISAHAVHGAEDYRDDKCFLGGRQAFADFAQECYGSPSHEKPTLAIWGDSFAAHLYPGIAAQPWAKFYNITQLTTSACSVLPRGPVANRPYCEETRNQIEDYMLRIQPDILLVTSDWMRVTGSVESDALVALEVRDFLRSLRSKGLKNVVLIGPIPHWPMDLPQMEMRSWALGGGGTKVAATLPVASRLITAEPVFRKASEDAGGGYISLYDGLCQHGSCRTIVPVAGGCGAAPIQFDVDHLTVPGSDWVASHIIGPALGHAPTALPAAPIGVAIPFNAGSLGAGYLQTGWMPPEGWGTWTAGRSTAGVIEIPVQPGASVSAVRVTFWGQMGPGLEKEPLVIEISGNPPVSYEATVGRPVMTESLTLSPRAANAVASTGCLRMTFRAPQGKSPKMMGLNDDARVLGFGLREITLVR